jgi:hypothetical protein
MNNNRPVLLSIVVLFGFGIWATIQAEVVKSSLDIYWEDIRRFLPTTFEGRYDRVLFGEFIATYLQSIAFLCFYIGIFFLFCSFGAGLMRQEIKTEHMILKAAEKNLTLALNKEEELREEMQSVSRLEQQGFSHAEAVQQTEQKYAKNKMNHLKQFERAHKGEIHKRWKQAWTKGSKFTRCMTKVGCASVCLVLIIVVACGLAFLVYASFCEGLESSCSTQLVVLAAKRPSNIIVNSNYKRGMVVLGSGGNKNAFAAISDKIYTNSQNNQDVTFGMKSCSLDAGYEKGLVASNEDVVDQVTFDIKTVADPQQFFGVDKSCQQAQIGIAIPKDLNPIVNLTMESTLNIIGSETFQLKELSLKGVNAAAKINKLRMTYKSRESDPLHRAMYVSSDLGEVKVDGKCAKFTSSAVYEHGTVSDAECENYIHCE